MRIKQQPITADNVFEQMAILAKNDLIKKGIMPEIANKIAIDFVKEQGMDIIKRVSTK